MSLSSYIGTKIQTFYFLLYLMFFVNVGNLWFFDIILSSINLLLATNVDLLGSGLTPINGNDGMLITLLGSFLNS